MTEDQLSELLAFLAVRHPPLYMELRDLVNRGLVTQLPELLRLLWADKERFEQHEPTRTVQFLSDEEIEDARKEEGKEDPGTPGEKRRSCSARSTGGSKESKEGIRDDGPRPSQRDPE